MQHALAILAAMLLGACGEPSTSAPPKPPGKSLTDSLDKAREVEGVVRDQAEQQRNQIESLTQ